MPPETVSKKPKKAPTKSKASTTPVQGDQQIKTKGTQKKKQSVSENASPKEVGDVTLGLCDLSDETHNWNKLLLTEAAIRKRLDRRMKDKGIRDCRGHGQDIQAFRALHPRGETAFIQKVLVLTDTHCVKHVYTDDGGELIRDWMMVVENEETESSAGSDAELEQGDQGNDGKNAQTGPPKTLSEDDDTEFQSAIDELSELVKGMRTSKTVTPGIRTMIALHKLSHHETHQGQILNTPEDGEDSDEQPKSSKRAGKRETDDTESGGGVNKRPKTSQGDDTPIGKTKPRHFPQLGDDPSGTKEPIVEPLVVFKAILAAMEYGDSFNPEKMHSDMNEQFRAKLTKNQMEVLLSIAANAGLGQEYNLIWDRLCHLFKVKLPYCMTTADVKKMAAEDK